VPEELEDDDLSEEEAVYDERDLLEKIQRYAKKWNRPMERADIMLRQRQRGVAREQLRRQELELERLRKKTRKLLLPKHVKRDEFFLKELDNMEAAREHSHKSAMMNNKMEKLDDKILRAQERAAGIKRRRE